MATASVISQQFQQLIHRFKSVFEWNGSNLEWFTFARVYGDNITIQENPFGSLEVVDSSIITSKLKDSNVTTAKILIAI